MASTTKKVRKLDAICAKLKSVTNEEPSKTLTPENESVCDKESENLDSTTKHLTNGELNNECSSDLNLQNAEEKAENLKNDESFVSRRKKRKASTPRNIAQVREVLENFEDFDEKDELAEYEINNQNTTFPPEEDGDDESEHARSPKDDLEKCNGITGTNGVSDSAVITNHNPIANISSLHSGNKKHSRKARKPQNVVGIPLDLSISKTSTDNDSVNGESFEENFCPQNEDSNGFPDTPEDLSLASENCNTGESKPVSPTDKNESSEISISALKDYAENTMNELLQMYGLSGSEDCSIGQVSQKKLLQTVQSLSFKGDKSNLINSLIKNPAHLNGTVDLGLNTPLMSHLPSSVIKKGIYANFVSTSANKLKPQISSDGQPRITISQGCITSTGVPSNAPILLKPTPVGAGVKIKDELKNNTDFIRSVLHQQKQNNLVSGATKQLSPDYSTYLKRFNNGQECGVKYCKELSYREHFHCMDCNFRVFIKKEEMVRHYKWHRKREESLQHGFMRYSPMDDCSQKFNNCTHNGRQTHYHCLQDGCDKVYISTSDVQMHANYHRKDSAIIQEGFQRFRATEDCGTLTCAFYGQRTTHFHCRRNSCNFTFKNKADMEKHKTYHQKDEVLGRDGFKKFMKYEHCGYYGCRYSKVSNHIHCIRKGCNYVLHSTAQLYSHKRKHERRDFEAAYRKYREDGNSKDGPEGVSMATQVQLSDSNSTSLSIKKEPLDDSEMGDDFDMDDSLDSSSHMADSEGIKMEGDFEDNSSDIMSSAVSEASDCNVGNMSTLSSCTEDSVKFPEKESKAFNISDHMPNMSGDKLDGSLTLPIPNYNSPSTNQTIIKKEATSPQEATPALAQPKLPVFVPTSVLPQHTVTAIPLPARPPERILERREKDESWKNYLIRYTANDPCNSRCQYLYKDHYHCKVEGCLVLFKSKDGVREHARFHELQDRITPVAYETYEVDESCPQECQYNMKERHYHCIWSGCSHVVPHAGPTFGRLEHYRIHEFARTSAGKSYKSSPKLDDSNCPRRRGRPPKYPKNEIPVIPKIELSEEEIQESRKVAVNETENAKIINGFRTFAENELCPDELCIYRSKHHFHCARPRCHHATDRMDVLNLHAKDFHSFVTILDGFEFFDRNINCRRSHCHNNKANRHFHCIKPKCDYSFVRHSTMIQHDKKHKLCNSEKVQSVPLKKDFPVSLAQTFIPIVPALQTGTTSVIQAVPGTPLVKVSLPSHKLPATPGSESSVSSAVVSSSPVLHTVTNLSPADTPKSAQPGTVIVSPMCATAAAQAVSTGPITPSSAPGSAPASITGTVLASSTSSPVTFSNGQVQTIPKVEPSNAVVTSVIMSGANVLSLASVDSNNKPIVKTAGTFYPLSGLAKAEGMTLSSVGALSLPNSSLAIAVNPMQTVALSTLPLISPPCGTTVAPLASPLISTAVNQLPLTVLLQQKGNNAIPSPDWTVLRDKMHYSVDQNCGRPFCKLKKKDHFHCFECNQAFSDPARIKIHMGKHGLKFNKLEIHETYQPITIAPKPAGSVVNTEYKNSMSDRQAANSSSTADVALSDVDSDDNDEKSSSLNLNPSAFSNMIAKAQKENAAKTSFNLSDDYFSKSFSDTDNDSISGKLVIADIDNNGVSNPAEDDSLDTSMFSGNMDEAGNSSVSKWSGRKRTAPKNDDFVDSNTVVVKQRKTSNTSSNSPRTAKDDSIPDGYIRYRFKEDCKYPKCAYRQGVTHFHCARSDCGYSFSDRSRLIQHTLRHERIDSLTGGEMQQFRINQDCSRTGCEFVGKASHFHCLKCDYSCTDSSKVLTHRKHHAKMESINQQGFHKYSVSEDCGIDGCHYSSKQTHYHCLKSGCSYAVTGPAQMSSHKMKHANDS